MYFPEQPSPEWFVIDLLRHHEMAGVPLSELRKNLVVALREGRWDLDEMREMAETYGTKATLALVDTCIAEARTA